MGETLKWVEAGVSRDGGEGVMAIHGMVTNFVEAVFADTLSVHTLHFVAFASENTNRSSLISWCLSIAVVLWGLPWGVEGREFNGVHRFMAF